MLMQAMVAIKKSEQCLLIPPCLTVTRNTSTPNKAAQGEQSELIIRLLLPSRASPHRSPSASGCPLPLALHGLLAVLLLWRWGVWYIGDMLLQEVELLILLDCLLEMRSSHSLGRS